MGQRGLHGVIQAYAVGEELSPGTAVCHFEKAMPDTHGLSQLINQWFAQHSTPTQLPIVNFGALQVPTGGVSVNGANFTMTGLWTRYLSTGAWSSVKPGGLYVETAVLTE